MIPYFTKSRPTTPEAGPRDSVREVFETIVFVVALVLLLKLFVVEAFVIPTGSMAETLYGYQKQVHCPECEHDYPVNCSEEADPQDGVARPVVAATCPNCRYHVRFTPDYNPAFTSGDRVLVHKALYPLGLPPTRGDVVVFKFPVAPQTNHSATNYIKRLAGLGGETIALYRGDLYVHPNLSYPADARDDSQRLLYPRPEPGRELHVWEGRDPARATREARDDGQPMFPGDGVDYTYNNAEVALKAFEQARQNGFPPGGFELVRKPAELCLSMRRIVYDNDQQSTTLATKGVPPRWSSPGFVTDSPMLPRVFTHTGAARSTLEYAHRVGAPPSDLLGKDGEPVMQAGNTVRLDDWQRVTRPGGVWTPELFKPSRITNFLGYNTGESPPPFNGVRYGNGAFWVPDLMLECHAEIASAQDEVVLDLAKGNRRFHARFQDGNVSLGIARLDGEPEVIATAPTGMTSGGAYRLRFADFDGHLRVWVDGSELDLGANSNTTPWTDAQPTEGIDEDGFCADNDLKPARIHATGSVTISQIKLWEDTYYTTDSNQASTVETLYVQPGHYLCLGDNSGFSSDSRVWGVVPERLILGKAQMIFFPWSRIGLIK